VSGAAAPDVSIVVTAHDAAETVSRCLASIDATRAAAPPSEVLLVDDRSEDGTAEAARATGVSGLVVLRNEGLPTAGLTTRQTSLDQGIRAARGGAIYLTDVDGRVPSGWLARADEVSSGRVDVLVGRVRYEGRGLLSALMTCDGVVYQFLCSSLDALGAASGGVAGNLAFRREAYLAVGGFERLGPSLTEDLLLVRALQRARFRVRFDARSAVTVPAPASWSSIVARGRRTSRGESGLLGLAIALALVSLAGPAVVAAATGGAALGFLAARWLLGAGVLAFLCLERGELRAAAVAPLFEPFALATAAAVLAARAVSPDVVWGGVRYRKGLPVGD